MITFFCPFVNNEKLARSNPRCVFVRIFQVTFPTKKRILLSVVCFKSTFSHKNFRNKVFCVAMRRGKTKKRAKLCVALLCFYGRVVCVNLPI